MDIFFDKEKNKLFIIDFNPYGDMTDAILFEWEEIDTLTALTFKAVST